MRLDLFAALCGILVAIQSRVNGGLSAILGNGVEAALISFGSGFIILNLILKLMDILAYIIFVRMFLMKFSECQNGNSGYLSLN